MNVSAPSTVATAAAPAASSPVKSLGYNDFVTLLMTELKNQDPTQPLDPSQMVAQLATVSQVAQTVQMNQSLTSLLTASSISQAEQLIGRTVTSGDGSISGVVASVTVGANGSIATLTDGSTVPLTNGVTIGA